jgi:biuret amidohydrolase
MTLELDSEGLGLLIIDMMNDHMHPDGVSARYFGGLTDAQRSAIIANDVRLLEAARAKGLPVVHIRGENRWDTLDSATAEARRRKRPKHPPDVPFKIAGSWGAQIIDELAPRDDEPVVIKRGHSGFGFTELDVVLERLGISHCITIGGASTGCLSDTVREGAGYGYEFLIVPDAVYRPNDPVVEQLRHLADVSTTDEVLAALGIGRPASKTELTPSQELGVGDEGAIPIAVERRQRG